MQYLLQNCKTSRAGTSERQSDSGEGTGDIIIFSMLLIK